jgi:hypothetical protein
MKIELPMRHRRVIAGVLFLVALVGGTWTSTLVGDEHPETWGVLLGAAVGLGVAAGVLAGRRHTRPPTGPMVL